MINVRESFLKLTEFTTPHGKESLTIEIIRSILPFVNFRFDKYDNMFHVIPNTDGTFSDVMFTSHMDTINNYTGKYTETGERNECKPITHVFDENNEIVKTDGKTNLGADDKTGVVIMLNLISENVPGLYYFFLGEECGCIGSGQCSTDFQMRFGHDIPHINKIISFDRRGYDSVITHQSSSRTCSEEFAKEFSDRLNEFGFWYKPDSTGIYTDSAEFAYDIPECTNLSVGYFNEHTLLEEQDVEFLEYLSECLAKINFNTLPVKRDVSSFEYDQKNYRHYRKFTKNTLNDVTTYTATKTVLPAKNNDIISNTDFYKKPGVIEKVTNLFGGGKKSKNHDRHLDDRSGTFDGEFYEWYNQQVDSSNPGEYIDDVPVTYKDLL